jgi:three-Cys-motif partner protein
MADSHHEWRIGEPPPIIRAHSLAKHRVVERYFSVYVDVLTSDLKIPEFRCTLVDGFAGGGLYRDSQTGEQRLGSPLLMLSAMRDAAAIAQAKRSKAFGMDVEYLFIEEHADHFAFLKQTIQQSDFTAMVPDKVKLIHGTFLQNVDSIVAHIRKRGKKRRAIFLLDQFGYSDVPFGSIRSILSQLENAEIILTFASDSLIDYLSQKDCTQTILRNLGLELSKEKIRSAKEEIDWRCAIQVLLHDEIFVKSGAKHYTPFFIRSKDAHRDYWLIHLSNHSRARDVMMGLHWEENNCFAHYGRPGLFMLGYDPDHDIMITAQPFLFDECALARTHDSLMSELPERVFKFQNGITFDQLFSKLTNESPATSSIMKAALAVMVQDGEIDVRDKTGHVKRQTGIQHGSDVLKPAAQRTFYVLGN